MLGVWIARRCSPKILFWIAYWRRDGTRVKVDVGVDSVMKVLAPKKKKPIKLEDEEGMATTIRAPPPPTRCLFLHVRVVQRVDAAGNGFGELRYICTDLGVSYRLGNTGHYWKQDQSVFLRLRTRTRTHWRCRRCRCSPLLVRAWLLCCSLVARC